MSSPALAARRGTVVLTGATSGIGLATARRLASHVDRLVLQGPEPEDAAAEVVASVHAAGPARIEYVSCDFQRLSDVAALARAVARSGAVSALINNAGVPGSRERRVTADGHERTLQVNFLAMVLLTDGLWPALAAGARVVNLASATHEMASLDLEDIELERGYTPVRAYARSKLAIILYTRWLSRHRTGATAVSLQPGVIDTGLLHAMFGPIGTTVDRGAASVLHALDVRAAGGEYFDEQRLTSPSAEAQDDALGDALMRWAAEALHPFAS